MDYRRRVEPQPAAWAGFCHIAGESPTMWRDCEVIDISMFGLGITLQHPQPWELVHRRILVDITSIGDAMNVRLEGEIKDAAFTLEGDIRVGLEFTGLSRPGRRSRPSSVGSTRSIRGAWHRGCGLEALPEERPCNAALSRLGRQRIPLEELPHRLVGVDEDDAPPDTGQNPVLRRPHVQRASRPDVP